MSGYDGYQDYAEDEYADEEPEAQAGRPRRARAGATPLGAGLAGLIVGALLAGIGLIAIGGNPFSDANDVVYREIVVSEISDAGDQICWSTEPGRRDAPQECAILAIDPAAAAPEDGERVTVGLVRLKPPTGDGVQQVVYVRGTGPAEPAEEGGSSGEENAAAGDSTDGDADSSTSESSADS